MLKCKLKAFLLLWYILHISAEETLKETQTDQDLGQISHNDESANRTSLFSKLSSWFLSTTQSRSDHNDLEAAEGGYGPEIYSASNNINCHICNQSPWIPIHGQARPNSVIQYGPPKDFSSHTLDQNIISDHFGFFGSGPSSLYSASPVDKPESYNIPEVVQIVDHMVPPPVNYQIPLPVYGRPDKTYGPPQHKIYDSPKKSYFGPFPKPNYGPPKQTYGPHHKPVYGSPNSLNRPPKPGHNQLKPHYGSPKPVYGPPKPVYGSPLKPLYGPPDKTNTYSAPNSIYGPPHPISQYGPPLSRPPAPEYAPHPPHPPASEYGPPRLPHENEFGSPSLIAEYGPPPSSPIPEYGIPVNPQYSPPNNYQQGPPTILEYDIPPKLGSNHPQVYTNSLDSSINPSFASHDNGFGTHLATVPSNSVQVPSDSYGAPVTNDNAELADAIAASSGEIDEYNQQIPLPNLSTLPVLPIRNHRNFNKELTSKSLPFTEKHQASSDVQIQPSVELVNFIASIEHPINVIQSPVLEVSVKEPFDKGQGTQKSLNGPLNLIFSNEQDKTEQIPHEKLSIDHGNQNVNGQNQLYSRNIQDEITKSENYNKNNGFNKQISFKDNPIIVEDINVAASEISNANISNNSQLYKNNGSNSSNHYVVNFSNNNQEDSLFRELLTEVDRNIGKTPKSLTDFTPATIDYSAWLPTVTKSIPTSMVPPAAYSTPTWSSPNKIQKPLQIIVPYTHEKKNTYNGKDWSLKTPKWIPPKESYSTLGSFHSPPMVTEESVWSKFMDDLKVTEAKKLPPAGFTTASYNFPNYMNNDNSHSMSVSTPYNEFTLQKSIDNWTQQSYSTPNFKKEQYSSKIIPSVFLPTKPYLTSTEIPVKMEHSNVESAASVNKLSVVDSRGNSVDDNQNGSVDGKTASKVFSSMSAKNIKVIEKKPLWSTSQITESPQTKEKVYVVTPQSYGFVTSTPATAWSMAPKVQNGKVNNGTYDSHKFTVRIESENASSKTVKNEKTGAIKVVFSEWPHLINSLESTTYKPTSRHPLFGLMDIADYTTQSATVESSSDGSNVSTVTTTSLIESSPGSSAIPQHENGP